MVTVDDVMDRVFDHVRGGLYLHFALMLECEEVLFDSVGREDGMSFEDGYRLGRYLLAAVLADNKAEGDKLTE